MPEVDPKRETLELRPISSADLVETMRGTDRFQYQTHVNVTREMLPHIKTIVRIGELFSKRWTTGEDSFAEHFPDWGDFPLLHAAAEITEASQALEKMGVVLIANKLFSHGDSIEDASLFLYISFECEGTTARTIKTFRFLV